MKYKLQIIFYKCCEWKVFRKWNTPVKYRTLRNLKYLGAVTWSLCTRHHSNSLKGVKILEDDVSVSPSPCRQLVSKTLHILLQESQFYTDTDQSMGRTWSFCQQISTKVHTLEKVAEVRQANFTAATTAAPTVTGRGLHHIFPQSKNDIFKISTKYSFSRFHWAV